MAKLSSAAWIAHDVGLATVIGGTIFGRKVMQPALREVADDQQRDLVSDSAWRKFSWINLAAHAVIAATWFTGRTMLSGREVSRTSRKLTLVKDALVVASLVSGVASVVLGRMLGKCIREQPGELAETARLRKAVNVVGLTNLIANVGVGGVTTALSMEASHSLPFSVVSRKLP